MDDELVERLRAAGCVFAEAEAGALRDAFSGPELEAAVHRRTAGVPLEQVVGFAEVDGLRIDMAPGVFVPRQRARVIADIAVARRPGRESSSTSAAGRARWRHCYVGPSRPRG